MMRLNAFNFNVNAINEVFHRQVFALFLISL
jgi:hypothetical protein